MAASTMIGTVKKQKQIGILVVLEAQEIDFRGTLKANMMNIVYFYVNLFRFTKNFPLLSLCRLTEICLPQSPKPHVLNWCLLVGNVTMQIKSTAV